MIQVVLLLFLTASTALAGRVTEFKDFDRELLNYGVSRTYSEEGYKGLESYAEKRFYKAMS